MKQKKYKIITGPESIQGSEAWLKFREGKVGMSDLGAIMGVNPWETALQAWERIKYNKKKPKTAAMERGNEKEEGARQILCRQTGRNYQPVVLQSLLQPDLICSLDAYWEAPNGDVYIAEIKVPGRSAQQCALEGKIPEYYVPQVAGQENLVEPVETLYFSWDGITNYVQPIVYERDERFVLKLESEISDFISSLVDFKPPEPTDKDWTTIVDLDKENKLRERAELIQQINCLREKVDEIEKDFVFDHPRIRIGDYNIQKVDRRGPVDYGKIEILQGIDLNKYRKPSSSYWTIRERWEYFNSSFS